MLAAASSVSASKITIPNELSSVFRVRPARISTPHLYQRLQVGEVLCDGRLFFRRWAVCEHSGTCRLNLVQILIWLRHARSPALVKVFGRHLPGH
jgi:hypothetical protein